MREFMAREDVPGAAIAITKGSRLVYARGFGYANVEAQEFAKPDSPFRIASISKSFTAAGVMKLVELGRLALDAKCAEILRLSAPMDSRWNNITLRQLLRHSGGRDENAFAIMFETRGMARALGKPLPLSPEQLLEYMLRRPLDFDPGTKFGYSNFGFFLLGMVIQSVTGGLGYERFIRDQVLLPCGSTHTILGQTLLKDAVPGEVRYYSGRKAPSLFDNDKEVSAPYGMWSLELMAANGGWVSTVIDLLRYGRTFNTPNASPMLSSASIETMLEQPAGKAGEVAGGNYPAMGWFVWPSHAQPHKALASVNGITDGTSSYLMRRTDGLNWAVLFNKASAGDGKPLMLRFRDESAAILNSVDAWPQDDQFTNFSL